MVERALYPLRSVLHGAKIMAVLAQIDVVAREIAAINTRYAIEYLRISRRVIIDRYYFKCRYSLKYYSCCFMSLRFARSPQKRI